MIKYNFHFVLLFLRKGFCVAIAVLELTLYTRLSVNSQRSACRCLQMLSLKARATTAWQDIVHMVCIYVLSL